MVNQLVAECGGWPAFIYLAILLVIFLICFVRFFISVLEAIFFADDDDVFGE